MGEYCIVVSKIIRKNVHVAAQSESEAIMKAKKLYDEGYVTLDQTDKEHINFHIKYQFSNEGQILVLISCKIVMDTA